MVEPKKEIHVRVTGAPGVGKTHVVAALWNALEALDVPVIFDEQNAASIPIERLEERMMDMRRIAAFPDAEQVVVRVVERTTNQRKPSDPALQRERSVEERLARLERCLQPQLEHMEDMERLAPDLPMIEAQVRLREAGLREDDVLVLGSPSEGYTAFHHDLRGAGPTKAEAILDLATKAAK